MHDEWPDCAFVLGGQAVRSSDDMPRSDVAQHEKYAGEIGHRPGRRQILLVISAQAPVIFKPRICTLNNPTTRARLEFTSAEIGFDAFHIQWPIFATWHAPNARSGCRQPRLSAAPSGQYICVGDR